MLHVMNFVQAAEAFANNTLEMVEKINARARHSTELINLVQLQRQFQNLASNDKSNDQKVPRLQSEAQTQTDTHIKV